MTSTDAVTDSDLGERMPLVEHLRELRSRLLRALAAFVVGGIVCFAAYDHILELMIQPYAEVTGKSTLHILSPLDGFGIRLRVAGYGGVALGSPVILWQIWRFVTPGLHKHERRYAIPFLLTSILLFGLGAALAVVTLPKAIEFLVGFAGRNVETLFTADRYLTFVLRVVIGFGIAFEFPILLVFLQLARVVTSRQLLRQWRYAVVIVFAVAAIITPSQDPVTLLAMAGPMSLFYFGAILMGRLFKR